MRFLGVSARTAPSRTGSYREGEEAPAVAKALQEIEGVVWAEKPSAPWT